MKIVEPKVHRLVQQNNMYEHISECAKICYATERIADFKTFCNKLWNSEHRSMFRHAGVYYIIPADVPFSVNTNNGIYMNFYLTKDYAYVSTNEQFAREKMKEYDEYRIDTLQAFNTREFLENKMLYYTFVVETGIDISRELNRTSPNAIAEQSTRYVDFNKKIGIRFKKCHWMYNMNLWKKFLVWFMCKTDECFYKISRSKYGLNLKPQDARWCLFLDTMTKVAYTYSVRDWERILNLRYFGWTGVPHPDAKYVATCIYNYLTDEGYGITNYKTKY